jgi:hypothetical protein
MTRFMIPLLLALVVGSPAWGNERGNFLYAQCNGADAGGEPFCVGFISGVIDTVEMAMDVKPYCVRGTGATRGQLLDVFRKYLQENPQTRHESAAMLLVLALKQAFPCK